MPTDLKAFEAVYREHVGAVFGLCRRLTRDEAAAEDATQEVFLRAWRAFGQFESRAAIGTWLHRIAVNVVIESRRRKSSQLLTFTAEPLPELDGAWTLDTPVEEAELEAAVQALPEGARDVLVLSGIYAYSHEETAAMLGIAVGTCKAQLHRARRLLTERLGMEEFKCA
jgi:RNA polymerase sigma-70 factor, ECF subfamily